MKQHTMADVTGLANFALGRVMRRWRLTGPELDDMRQDAIIAALEADATWKPKRAAWSTWVLCRIQSRLRNSLRSLRGAGLTGDYSDQPAIQPMAEFKEPKVDFTNPDDQYCDGEIQSDGDGPEAMAEQGQALESLQSDLGARDAKLLVMAFGLDGLPPMTREAMGKELGVSQPRISQLMPRALAKAKRVLYK